MGSADSSGALSVLTIVDLSESVAGSHAARLLAGYGAQVIKVERPGSRDPSSAGSGSGFSTLNAGKMSLTLDYETKAGAAVLRRLLEYCDGIIEDHPTLRQEEYGLNAEALIARIPRLVICKVSFSKSDSSQTNTASKYAGPAANRPANQSLNPPDADGAAFDAINDAALSHGLHVVVGALGGLWRAAQTEHGQVVEVESLETFASTLGEGLARRLNLETPVNEPSSATSGPDRAGLRVYGGGVDVDRPIAGYVTQATGPFAMADTPWLPGAAPLLGEHTEYVLQDIVGLDAAELESLRAEGIV